MKLAALHALMTRDRDRPRVLVRLDTDDGACGWGECYNHGPDRALPPLFECLSLRLQGEDPTRIERLVLKLLPQSPIPSGALRLRPVRPSTTRCGTHPQRRWGVPAYRLLGGHVRDRGLVRLGLSPAPKPATVHQYRNAIYDVYGLTAFKLSPYRIDIHANPWGE